MALNTSTLRPGFLVSLKTSTRGNVSYQKTELETGTDEQGAALARWETRRVIVDPAEQEAAGKARAKAQNAIRRICAHSAFGLLCPEGDADKLDTAIKEARAIVEAFNATAKLTRVSVFILTGRIAPDDVEALKAINSEISDLMARMQAGIQKLDVKEVREAASRAKDVGAMLSADAQARVQIAVEVARSAASQIVKAGETAAAEIDQSAIRKITEMRTAFLDLDSDGKPIAAPAATAPGVDFETAPMTTFIERSQPKEMEI